jgi:hypothetical protein
VVKLNDQHPVKRWLKFISQPKKLTPKEEETKAFLVEILNSQFNLITDLKVKARIIETLSQMKGASLTEKILKSYLYLLVGNITRSDNILKEIIRTPPVKLWIQDHAQGQSSFDLIAKDNLEQILERLSRHPSDRKAENLFISYLLAFTNDPVFREKLGDLDISQIDGVLNLKYTEHMAPDFVHYLRLARLESTKRNGRLLKMNWFSTEKKAYWIWPFLELEPVITAEVAKELKSFEETDLLWFVYLMEDERMSDAFQRKNKQSFLPGRRQYLRSQLKERKTFMLALYKVIEFGDIDESIVKETLGYVTGE